MKTFLYILWTWLKFKGISIVAMPGELIFALVNKIITGYKWLKIGYQTSTYRLLSLVLTFIGSINWEWLRQIFSYNGLHYSLTPQDHAKLRELLKPDYYFIVTRRNSHLSTYLVSLVSLFTTGKFSHYSHSLMNVDDGNIRNDQDFKLVEATSKGVHYSTFTKVFDCDSVALLKPKNLSAEEWTFVLDKLLNNLGKQYDNLFDILDDTHLSCIELCRNALQGEPNYEQDFKNFEYMIKKYSYKLTPQMLYDCTDFEVVFEVRR